MAFYWHFARQAKPLFAALFVAGFIVALLDTMIPIFIGRIVTLVTSAKPEDAVRRARHDCCSAWRWCCCSLRPAAITTQNLLANQAIAANVSNRIRWQNHWHVVRQSWAFFQNDFAGRIANRVMQTGPAIRETIVALITGVWYILVYGTSARDPARAARTRGSRFRSRCGSAAIWCCCACSCRACATAPRRCRSRARC